MPNTSAPQDEIDRAFADADAQGQASETLAVPLQVEVIESRGIPAIESVSRAEIDVQIDIARRYPRSLARCKESCRNWIKEDKDTAAACWYTMPRGNKTISGPSVGLARLLAQAWEHLRIQVRIVEEQEKYVIVEAVAMDLQQNYAICVPIRRRITDKNGNRYNDDMINMTVSAAKAIAFREAVFQIVPRPIINEMVTVAKMVVGGEVETIGARRKSMLQYFEKLGVKESEICSLIEVKAISDIGPEQMGTLIGLAKSIEQGTMQVEMLLAAVRNREAAELGAAAAAVSGSVSDGS